MGTQEYVIHKDDHGATVTVQKMGLVVNGISACSYRSEWECHRDIKNILMNKEWSFREVVRQGSSDTASELLSGDGGGGATLQLKRSHGFYYQCQGQVNIVSLPCVDILVSVS
jgi:hypothetical protein